MDDHKRHEQGMQVRREVLGDAHVDRAVERTTSFTEDFQDLITRYAWGEIWARPGLDRRMRSAVTLTALVATGREHDVGGRLGAIAVPTLAIAGAEDPTSPPEHLEAIAAEIPNARLAVIPRAAHLVNVERADEFNDALLAHLA